MPSTLDSSGLTSYSVPRGKLDPSNNGTAASIALKTATGSDPSPTAPLFIGMRANASSGALFEGRAIIAPLSLTLSSGSTLGISSGVPFRVWDLLIDDAGTFCIGSIVCTTPNSFVSLDETKLISSVAEGGAGGADSAGVIYTNVAVVNKPFRILGSRTYESGLATAGIWNVDPAVQMFGPGIKKPGELVQTASDINATAQSGNSLMYRDPSKPQNNEGTQWYSVSITPESGANRLRHETLLNLYAQANSGGIIAALFQDSGADAIAAAWDQMGAGETSQIQMIKEQIAQTASQTTFKVRVGPVLSVYISVNGTTDASGVNTQYLGGTLTSGHTITEFQA